MGWLWSHADAMMDFVRPLSGTILDACNRPEGDSSSQRKAPPKRGRLAAQLSKK